MFLDMVSQTRLEYGFIGYQVPVFPRASRSAREGETFVPPNCKKDQQNACKNRVLKEQEDEIQSSKCNLSDKETYNEKTLSGYHQIRTVNKFSHAPDQFNLKPYSSLKGFDKLANVSGRNANHSSELGISSLISGEFSVGQFEDARAELSIIQTVKSETLQPTGSLDALEMDCKPPHYFCSGSKTSLFKDWTTLGPSRRSDTIETVSRDDNGNYMADQRIKNLSSSRRWRVSPNLNGGASFRNDGKRRKIFHDGRTSYSRQRSKRISPLKRRDFFNQCRFSGSDRGFQLDDRFNSAADKRVDDDNYCAAIRVASSVASPHPHPGSRDRNVKLRIKSFKVPELLVEIPTTATVGSLKRSVMEAVTTVLGDGLHVGILLQGKKVRDDSKTLIQTGISRDGKHRNLGFMLEPRHAQIKLPRCLGEQGITSHATSFTLDPRTSSISLDPPVAGCINGAQRDHHLVPSLPNISASTTLPNSQSRVSVPAISGEALAVVPIHHRAGRREFVQRRIRRPFSVSEVEALVQAVEKLGTGRWRDVKLRAFDNAKHRTYVDLKDKWKTLVHTARISPQQRRGEPVPQELLDRVLAVHAYRSQQQAKQQQLKSGV
ncbi:telomere repeat-binding protein 6 isoform X6 [Gossypium hirsutum]|uniref:Telomere repeat-binding protein 6 isoform X6 n=2 Tax=Gossypium hirsutum TaxID=3635 RepID=A0ABM2YQC7_GOSHI|nr:telomere repeat-binding protein 6 isoform X6 [Gossypium hirsutum]